jgi:hypothetical protein
MYLIRFLKDKILDNELQKYYENMFSMFATQGWRDLLEDLQKIKDSINDISTVGNEQSLFYRKGQLDILDLVLQRKVVCEKTYEELANEKDV